MADVWQVTVAAPTKDAATALAGSVVQERLAAGAQVIGPVTSAFWHLGEYGLGEEWQLRLITTAERYTALEDHLVRHHEWTHPEITAVPVSAGLAGYMDWVARTVQ